ncbi:MAG: hypothetical protein HY904_26195 [Deltaproteobacteria bacterium]|nr:hypothetical protein [Deltaproteobacteria bacterium]
MPPQDPRSPPPRPPQAIRVGMGAVRRDTAPETARAATLPSGGPLASVAPGLEVKSLVLSDARGVDKIMELRDRKNAALWLQQTGPATFLIAMPVGRQKPVSVPLTLQAGKELVLPLAAAVDRAASEPKLAPHVAACRDVVRVMAAACEVELPAGFVSTAEQKAFRAGQEKQAFGNAPSQAWKGFAQQKGAAAPPMKPTTAADLAPSGQLAIIAPGLDGATLSVRSVNPTKGTVLLADGADRELTIKQTKFSLPPMFAYEYAAPGEEPRRGQILAAAAREVAELLEQLLVLGAHDPATLKSGALVVKALLKVM